ncbi:FtsK/SpoIIIE domain-containing protein [Nocardia mexicana]|uniref:S-DNA-T family DNA segregation ATPase FtsK/SpoIIIE n=1 Tax=Nocardia mexicana TaxID=279262 RepID=A0A370GZ19_9NOCA|nr:FtsK/SpoIIIE domain-containing protein [Nocardia mexicana]RDI48530.1 S-DNA-T family DNA segregation ATPase FtsK/SpoIIIE [Nocardia mexicana]
MTVVDMVPYAVAAAGAAGLFTRMCLWRRLPAHNTPRPIAEIMAEAPEVLRTAVLHIAVTGYTWRMFADLRLGSVDKGFPTVEWWDYDRHGLTVDLLMLGGQSLSDWTQDKTLDALAAYLGVPRVTASSPAPGWVRLQVRVHDTLAASTTRSTAVPNEVDLEAVPVGFREDGDLWLLRILYAHILLAGATGSGKGSVLWSILAGLGPAIRAKLVDVRMADPKGGAEFGRGEDKLFTRFATTAPTILALLEEAVREMDERLVRMRRAGVRKLVPTADEPLILIIIDEAASLSSYAERPEQEKFRQLTGLLLSKGRAAGVSVVAALQDPSKETMPNRQLFPVRIGLRLDEPTQTTMVHGQGSRARGARCDEISEHTPGVGYVGEDGTTEFVRVRAFWISDDQADDIVDTYSPAPEIAGPTEDYTGFDPDDLGDESAGGDLGEAA